MAKNAQIKATSIATRARRATMTPRVYHIKITADRLNRSQAEALNRIFLEAKWLRNAALADGSWDGDYAKAHGYVVRVKVKDSYEDRELTTLGSQVAQAVVQELNDNRRSVKAAAANGRKAGTVRFTSQVRSVNLKQFGTTYNINTERSRVRVQGIPGWVRVRGLDQIPANAELANAKLLRKPDGHYLAVTCYTHPTPETFMPGTSIGLDMNVGRPIVLSDGRQIAAYVDETDRLRRLQRTRSRQVKGSNNYVKTCQAIEREYQKMDQRKDDLANKVVHDLLTYERVFMQDENISAWKRKDSLARGGKKIHHGILGRVKHKLVRHPRVTVLGKRVPTTAWCRECHNTTPHTLDKRTYQCQHCGWTHPDRDLASAENMILIGTNPQTYLLPVERGDVKPVENSATAKPSGRRKPSSTKQEAASSSATP